MAAVLPSSLSPHICVLPSPELVNLLKNADLPPIHHILQSFSPLQQVTSRTTSLQTVPLSTFALRVSDLLEVEAACKEDENTRAARAIDWIGGRIAKKAATWLSDDYGAPRPKGNRTPWWDELRRCTEGDYTPSRTEGWNHPAAVILAVSTSAPNPLAAISALHARPSDLPQWVDPNVLRYTLIVHTRHSTLNDDECLALFNAAKRQWGLHAHFLTLDLGEPATPVPLFTIPPRLPLAGLPGAVDISETNELRMSQDDLQQIGKFVREFVVMSLIPWMERCVLDWNESFSANRRLPTRIFSTTRRLFGSSTGSISSASAVASPTSASPNGQQLPPASAPPQQRRLAEFATILGDYRLAIPVWEAWRKEGRGGSEVLPLLLAPSPAVGAHVAYALQPFQSSELTAQAQYRALLFAVRWEVGVQEFHNQGGDRWLSSAAGYAEEPYAAVLLAHAALVAARQGGLRRASMWYTDAARRMEKSGVKHLAIYFLRQADDLLRIKSPRSLSDSFQGAAGCDTRGFPALGLRVEHSLSRLLYATGDTEASIRLFSSLFRSYTTKMVTYLHEEGAGNAQGIIDDFRVAFEHIHSTGAAADLLASLQPSISFALPTETRLRFERESIPEGTTLEQWDELEGIWTPFAKQNNFGRVGKRSVADVDESFWVDLALRNPLEAEITLVGLTVAVEQSVQDNKFPTIEIIDEIKLAPKEQRTVSLRLAAHYNSPIKITHLNYSFLSLLPMSESLARRGRRLHDTALQRLAPTYAPDVPLFVEISNHLPRLDIMWGDRDDWSVLAGGELRQATLHFVNRGTKTIGEIWLIRDAECPIVVVGEEQALDDADIFSSTNRLAAPEPTCIDLNAVHGSSALHPGQSCKVSLVVAVGDSDCEDIRLLFNYRENAETPFYSIPIRRIYTVKPIMNVELSARPRNGSYLVEIGMESQIGETIQLTQITCISPSWMGSLLSDGGDDSGRCQVLDPQQTALFALKAQPWTEGQGTAETFAYATEAFRGLLDGGASPSSFPPSIDVRYSNLYPSACVPSSISMRCAVEFARRRRLVRAVAAQYTHIPRHSHPHIFPLYHPGALDVAVQWSLPLQQRRGVLVLSHRLVLGATHGALDSVLESAGTGKAKRTMYAETQRAQAEILEAVRQSEWNRETNPLVVTVAQSVASHDFSKGPCTLALKFTVHNYSATNCAKFVLRLVNTSHHASGGRKAAVFVGQLAHRGIIQPYEHTTVPVKVWLPHPGKYGLGLWRLETEVGEVFEDERSEWRPRARYLSTADEDTVVEVNAM